MYNGWRKQMNKEEAIEKVKEVSKDAYANSILDLGKAWKSMFNSVRGTRRGRR